MYKPNLLNGLFNPSQNITFALGLLDGLEILLVSWYITASAILLITPSHTTILLFMFVTTRALRQIRW
jgi:hypothetical protein